MSQLWKCTLNTDFLKFQVLKGKYESSISVERWKIRADFRFSLRLSSDQNIPLAANNVLYLIHDMYAYTEYCNTKDPGTKCTYSIFFRCPV